MTHQSITHKVALSEFVKRKKNEIVIKRKMEIVIEEIDDRNDELGEERQSEGQGSEDHAVRIRRPDFFSNILQKHSESIWFR